MSFLVLDGFDNYRIQDLNAIDGWNGGTPFSYPDGRIDGKGVTLLANNGIYMSVSPEIVGFAFKNVTGDPGIFGTSGQIFYLLTPRHTCTVETNVCPGTPYVVNFKTGLALDNANRLFLYQTGWFDDGTCMIGGHPHPEKCNQWKRFDTTFYGWGETPALNYNEWNYVEINFGTLEVRLNGGTIITSSSTVSGPGSPLWSEEGIDDERVYFQVPQILNSIVFDDFYAQDATGDFVGDIHIKTVYPDADGHYTDWTPGHGGSGTDHFTRVDEQQMDGNASYNYSDTATQRDSYLMQAMGVSSATIFATQLNLAVALGNGVETALPQAFIRQGGVDYDGADLGLSVFDETGSGYWRASFISDEDPTGSPWTPTTVDGDEYGIHLESIVNIP